jgi:hypothetical protein
MASSISTPHDPFQEGQVASTVTAEESLSFFQAHGAFYKEDPEIGRLVADLDRKGLGWSRKEFSHYLPRLLEDERIRRILEPFDKESPSICYSFGSNYPGHWFVSTIEENQDDRILIYMWSAGAELAFADGFHLLLPLKGIKAPNGMYEVPYKFLKNRDVREVKFSMEAGGV